MSRARPGVLQVRRTHPVLTLLLTLSASVACRGGGGNGSPSGSTTGIGPQGGTVSGPYGAQVIIPAGALTSQVEIAATRDSSNAPEFPPSGTGAAGAAYEITPHGTTFDLPVTLRIPFDATQVPAEATPKLYKAEQGGAFSEIPSTVDGDVLVADVTDLSWVIPGYASARPRNVYVNTPSGVASYRIDSATGALSGPTSAAPTGQEPIAIVTHPSGRFAFVTNAGRASVNGVGPRSVSVYGLDATTGAITGPTSTVPATTASVQAMPATAVVHPAGKFLYVVNYGQSGGNTDVSLYAIDPSTGALTGPVSNADSGGAPTTAMAIDPSGKFAYVTYSWRTSTPVGNTYSQQVKVFSIDAATGALTGPSSGVAVSDTPWAIAVDPSGRFAYVGSIGNSSYDDQVRAYRIDAATGALTYQGSVTVSANPASLAMDSQGRFLHVAKQKPFSNVNVEVYAIDGSTGLLTSAGSVLSGSGALVGPVAVIAEPMGNFAYVVDSNGELVSYQVSSTGTLSLAGTVTPVTVPGYGGVGVPFSFAATGTSPLWVDGCTVGCDVVLGGTGSGGGGGGGGGSGGGNGRHYLDVSHGHWGGWITSTPSGIDVGHSWFASPPSSSSAEFTSGAVVRLCEIPPPNPVQGYDVQWTGGCSGTGACVDVVMDRDRSCHLELIPVSQNGGGGGGGGGGAGGGSGKHHLDVSHGAWGGWITSTPPGIDYGHDWVPTPPGLVSAQFASGSVVRLCETPPPTPVQAYHVQWTGGCSGTGTCVDVYMDRDKSCHLELIP